MTKSSQFSQMIEEIDSLLLHKIHPCVADIDTSLKKLFKAYKILDKQHLLALFAPPEYGGYSWKSEHTFRFSELLTSYSGGFRVCNN